MTPEDSVRLFDPKRLTQGRELYGLTKAALAKKAGVSAASIGQYEAGISTPTVARLAELSLALGLPVDFFATRTYTPRNTDGFFRSLRSASGMRKKQALAYAEIINELISVLEEFVRLPTLNLPSTVRHSQEWTLESIEKLAQEIRCHYQLPKGPIPHVIRLLESNGVIVSRVKGADSRLSAFSVPALPRPVVVLTTDKSDKARSRFDAAHELGHLLMHDDSEIGSQVIERQANMFASAFLMPAEDIRSDLPKRFSIAALTDLKKTWGVSMAAILYRSNTLDVISDSAYQRGMIKLTQLGYRNNEPEILGAPELPVIFTKALEIAESKGISFSDIAAKMAIPESFLSKLIEEDVDRRPSIFEPVSNNIVALDRASDRT